MGNNVYGRARYTDSLVNQNFGGGVKKQGLASTVGLPSTVSSIYRMRLGCPCPGNKFIISTTRTTSHIGQTAGSGRYNGYTSL
jgi:hypothetical protein